MTGMLASVKSVREAKIVIENDVDIVDIKNPKQGALGALNHDAVKCIVKTVNRRIPVSATVGDLDINDAGLLKKIRVMASTGVDFIKVGLFSDSLPGNYLDAISHACEKGIKIVIVMFAEGRYQGNIHGRLIDSGVSGLMMDTRSKSGKRLIEFMNGAELQSFVSYVHAHGLFCGLAGSLTHQDIPELLTYRPDYLGFRGALCQNNERVSRLSEVKVRVIREAIPVTQRSINKKAVKRKDMKEVNQDVSMA